MVVFPTPPLKLAIVTIMQAGYQALALAVKPLSVWASGGPPPGASPGGSWCPSSFPGALVRLLGGSVGTFHPSPDRLVFGWVENNSLPKMAVSLDMTGFEAVLAMIE